MSEPEVEIKFEDLNLHPDLLRGIKSLGFIRPTPIQAQAIPHILAGRDLIGCAQTGTGKTAAFVLPILHKLLQGKSGQHVRALIIAPTRELALQSMEHLRSLSQHVHLKGEAIFGGAPMQLQISALARGVDILSATPGRLLDHIYSGRIDFRDLQVLVLDEADRMLDMGFLPDIHGILRLLPPKNQRLLFSATMPKEILDLAKEILSDPVTVQVGHRSAPAVGIRHAVYAAPQHLKTDILMELLRSRDMTSVLVFARTKISADRLARDLQRGGIRVSVLHGDRSQEQRFDALRRFRYGRTQVMVATDVAARGIDVDEISHVINFDVPRTVEDYVHRIGRTARGETTGDAFTLVDKKEEPMVREIEETLKLKLPRVILPQFKNKRTESSRNRSSGSRPAAQGHRRTGAGPSRPRGSRGGRPPRRRSR